MNMYSAAGRVDNAVSACQSSSWYGSSSLSTLTSYKHSKSGQSSMLRLESLKQRRQCQDVEECVDKIKMDEGKGIEPVH